MAAQHESQLSSSKATPLAQIHPETGYISNIDDIRQSEYPSLTGTTYLDHAGATLYARSLVEGYSKALMDNLYGNPHSASASSQLSTRRIDDVRFQTLRFFNADPDKFDIVFVANATAAIKLVADVFRDQAGGFHYAYHTEAHTSLVGVRELALPGAFCFASDSEVDSWLNGPEAGGPSCPNSRTPSLFAYPAQSNMTGRRLPMKWCQMVQDINARSGTAFYTLLDAAALVSTAPLDLSHSDIAPDFIALSFYKIFGLPDLGALIVRKDSGGILRGRRYFGGGTVDSVTVQDASWYARKESSLHSCLEDGTIPFHNIIALQIALQTHAKIYGSMSVISRHANFLASTLRERLAALKHGNGTKACVMYTDASLSGSTQGPVIAVNLKDERGGFVSNSEIEKLGVVKNIQFRTGGLCNPGGIASHLGLSAGEMRRNYAAGQRCGSENDIVNGKPTGAVRLSFGAMSSMEDVATFLHFVEEFYVSPVQAEKDLISYQVNLVHPSPTSYIVESLSVFPIKSCGAYNIPADVSWEVGPKGLAWDREWCLVHAGTNAALSQKKFPRMALLRPEIDLVKRMLKVFSNSETNGPVSFDISLDFEHTSIGHVDPCERTTNKSSVVCGESVDIEVYTSKAIMTFFTDILGVPCTLARFPKHGTVRQAQVRIPGRVQGKAAKETGRSITLANESPILLVSRSSVNRLNEQIKHNGGVGKTVAAASFRANIVVAEELEPGQKETPYAEDDWESISIKDGPKNHFDVLGPCQRCQMVCVDQKNAERRPEPFSTLAKTRRKHGRVWFGMHMSLTSSMCGELEAPVFVRVGDRVIPRIGES
ncbi:selenocysteine lyase [Exophiala aquamarina CBS 119918]|uniref:Molybdenum cofactor sulfurase n=1 Tax=Exophiala aquamarina CBS 119918 TaxID=1182545 RepID=A0A072P151_9EURO|nr:selenocysteine lyase [Exophiala aquamarina CBS 119918]KEF53839.1 selenocysteine lyase [Exophiala aquamarina CBS 119918]